MLADRRRRFDEVSHSIFDVAVVGAGIGGASVYHRLCREGYRVLLVDKRDFAGGTSQSSAMMVWGGLLYLAQRDFATVRHFCQSRDRMLRQLPDWVRLCPNRYVPTTDPGRRGWMVLLGLYSYWAFGGFRRARPRLERKFPERAFLRRERLRPTLVYEEATVEPSDARFVLHWILSTAGGESVAVNYCALAGGRWDAPTRTWHLELRDELTGREAVARARWVVNAAGVWTDEVNRRFDIESPYKHIFGKGVFVGLGRDHRHATPLTFENRNDGDCMTLIPWGPIALWGPTETVVTDLCRGFAPEPEDVRFLLGELNRHLARPARVEDIVSLRCGVRPLAVPRSYEAGRLTLNISRRQVIVENGRVPWTSLYGGKLTGCVALAESLAARLGRCLGPTGRRERSNDTQPMESGNFPGLDQPVLSARQAIEREMCWTLDDYLRRRTNIAQWVPRGGLGRGDEHLAHLEELAALFATATGRSAQDELSAYRSKIARDLDQVLARV
jgi:glycerol-3-phosphate dehydrogenase